MSKKPLLLPTSLLLFSDLTFRGFWMTRWTAEHDLPAKLAMYAQLAGWMEAGALHAPRHRVLPLREGEEGVLRRVMGEAAAGFAGHKVLLAFQAEHALPPPC
jgi:trans-2-enoyl-CoA reductase